MSSTIVDIHARQILDSRGNPTIEVDVELADGSFGRAAVPSGASTGIHEAWELRDGDKSQVPRQGGARRPSTTSTTSWPTSCAAWTPSIRPPWTARMIDLDGTENKKELGANAILGVSLATAHAAADHCGLPLFRYLGGVGARMLPAPMMNILNGGTHADNDVDVQEFMVMPLGFETFSDAIRCGCEVFHNLKKVLKGKKLSTNVGDEGGFAPNLKSNAEALDLIVEAIDKAGYEAGKQVFIALDPAASDFYDAEKKTYAIDGKKIDAAALVEIYAAWVDKYPICSIEDGCAEDDWDGWKLITERLGHKIQLVGDDLFVTNVKRLQRGIDEGICQQHPHQGEPDRHARPRRSRPSSWPGATATPPSSAIAAARPRTPRSPTWRWPWGPARSRPARPRGPTAWPSTTSCCGSRKMLGDAADLRRAAVPQDTLTRESRRHQSHSALTLTLSRRERGTFLMSIFIESPWPAILLGILGEAILAVILVRTGRGVLLVAMAGVLAASLLGVARRAAGGHRQQTHQGRALRHQGRPGGQRPETCAGRTSRRRTPTPASGPARSSAKGKSPS